MNAFVYNWYCKETTKTSIKAYGINERGENVCARIDDFTPYVYVGLNDEADAIPVLREIGRMILFSEIVYKEHLYNFKPGRHPFLFCQCASRTRIKEIVWRLKNPIDNQSYKTYESQATSVLQLVSLRKLDTAGWIAYEGTEVVGDEKITACDREYTVRWRNLYPSSEERCVQPKILAFDFEVNSEVVNSMPIDRPNDCIFQISCILKEKNGTTRKTLLSLDGIDYDDRRDDLMPGIEIVQFRSERELIGGFFDLVQRELPNVITGYNILGFDIPYLIKRCTRYFLYDDLCSMGFNVVEPSVEKSIRLNRKFKPVDDDKFFIDWEGMLILDLFPIVMADYKLDNYKLHTVATHFFDVGKDPVTPKQIFNAFETKKMAVVGKYCVQDSVLCIDLFDFLTCWIGISEMAKICNVTMFDLYTQGQQFKIFSQIYSYCLAKNIVVDSDGYESKSNERYTGAFVYEPEPGFYENVIPLDFSSLYPSIIIAHNICYSTIVDDRRTDDSKCNIFEWEDHVGCEHDTKVIETLNFTRRIDELEAKIKKLMIERDSVKGKTVKNRVQCQINVLRLEQKPLRESRQKVNKKVPEWTDDSGNKVNGMMCVKHRYRFLKPTVKLGVIPVIIQNLLDSRKRIKTEMKSIDDTDKNNKKLVLDKRQLAYKISANSMYGAMGVKRGYLPFMPGAMCITYVGRRSIEKTADIIRNDWKGKLVYGDTDSNYVIFPSIDTKDLWQYAIKVADAVSTSFPKPMRLEFEQTIYAKFLILSKKRYIYQSVNKDGVLDAEIGKKGVVLAKRDNSGALKQLFETVAMYIFDRRSTDDIINFVVDYVDGMFRTKLADDLFVVTKSVKDSSGDITDDGKLGDYKVKSLAVDESRRAKQLNGKSERDFYIASCPAQVRLAERMRLRGAPVDVGSRLEYVAVDKGLKCTLGDKIEDYDYFKLRRKYMRLDILYYLHSFINPIDQLLSVGIGHKTLTNDQYRYRTSFRKVINQLSDYGGPKITDDVNER